MYKETKPMLNSLELINYLEGKGIKFDLISKENAKKYLEANNNYFKLTSYRKNFHKYINGKNCGKYMNLDFKMLMDLAILDMRIRKTMLSIVLDLEHYTKVKLLSRIENTSKDGYTSVQEYIEYLKFKDEYDYLKSELNRIKIGIYCGELVEKYNDEFPVWAFIEIISFGRFIKFYKFVADKLKDKNMQDESFMLMVIRELRNACAHNNCIINDLRPNTSEYPISNKICNEVANIGISKKVRDNKLSNARIKQIVTLLYLNKNIVTSKGVLKNQIEMLQKLKGRIERHIDYYDKNELIKTSLEFLNEIIDKWYNNNI